MVTLYVEAHTTDEYDQGPDWAKITLDQPLLERIKTLQKLCEDNNLESVQVDSSVDMWGPGTIEEDLRVRGTSMVVDSESFWFKGFPKYSANIETGIIYTESTGFKDLLVSKEDNVAFYNITEAEVFDNAESEE